MTSDFWTDELFWDRPLLAVGLRGQLDFDKLQPVLWFKPHRGITIDSEGRYKWGDKGVYRPVDTTFAAKVLGVGEPHLRFWVVRYQLRRALVQTRSAVARRRTSLPVYRVMGQPMVRTPAEHAKWLEWQLAEEQTQGWWHGE